jgi:UDP-N-acetylmuramoyl-tripeptide--D-alanyl-D-alanine ligase
MEFLVRDIASAVGGERVRGSPDTRVKRITTDTRHLGPGEAFVALRGERFDGHDFVVQAVARGASCLVIDRREAAEAADPAAETAVVRVGDTLEALQALGRAARERLGCPVVAITGSCGKTTVKEMLGCILAGRLKGRTPPKSYNNLIGVPLTLLDAEEDDEFVLCEFGTNAPGEIAMLASIGRPAIGVVTLVAPAHLEGLGSVEGVAEEKAALVDALPQEGLAVLNADDPRVVAMAGRCRGRVVTVGREKSADVRAEEVRQTAEGLTVVAGAQEFRVPVYGEHQAVLALAAAVVARELGVGLREAAAALAAFRPPPMRMNVAQVGDVVLVNDAYNANPRSMRAALAVLSEWPERRKVFFCGDMLELGTASRHEHAALGRAIVDAEVNRLVCVGMETAATADVAREAGMPSEDVSRCGTSVEVADAVAETVRPGDVILVKGSRAMAMERVADAIVRTFGGKSAAGEVR